MSALTVSYLLHDMCARVAHSSAYIRVRYKSLVQYLCKRTCCDVYPNLIIGGKIFGSRGNPAEHRGMIYI